ncbi:putative tRNA methyltransferase 9B [Gastrophryne carolinensis]
MEKEANHLEKQHVHNVYEKIAPYFNDKRYKAWPKVQEFLLAQEPGCLVADIGCGNGKYLNINSQAYNIGCDYCVPLAEAAGNRGYEVLVCDGLHLPYRDECFDAVLSIAVIHHFSTKERRVQAIKEMARILRVGGRMMIYVWAMEQKRRKFAKQDLLIPWNKEPMQQNYLEKKITEPGSINHSLINPLSRVHSSVRATNITKSYLSVDATCSAIKSGLHSSKLLACSVDSGLDIRSKPLSSDHKHENILWKLKDCCTTLRKSSKAYPSRLPKPIHLLNQISDLIPKYMQHLENNTNKVTQLLTFSLANRSHRTPSNAELNKEVIKDLTKVLFPDLGPNCNGLFETMDCSNSGDHSKGVPCQEIKFVENPSCLRYYHIFKQGELGSLIEQCIPGLRVMRTFYDHSNWCVIAEKV